jgi:ABC-type multidrug transport system ATPase subunit/ABC-type multidrug transport system permease subunit
MSAQAPASSKSWLIGSSPDCEICVSSASVSSRHCRLTWHSGTYSLEDLGSTNGTFVNGHRLSPGVPVYLSRTDTLTLGQNTPFPWPAHESAVGLGGSGASDAAGNQVVTIGRNPDSDIHLDYPMISWNHARIVKTARGYAIEDLESTNGTAVNRVDNRIARADLLPTDEVYFGSYKIAASRLLAGTHVSKGESAFELINFRGDRMVIGRDPECDFPLDFPMISWRHAQFQRTPQGIVVEDLGSLNGTYLNGVRIGGKVSAKPGDEIGLGSFRFQILEGGSLAKREYNGNVTIEVAGVAVNAPNGDRLLDPVSLTVFPSEIIALMGPAGAGKTTFLKTLNGYTPPAAGRVLFNGDDLYQYYDRFRQQMGYVPQDDIVHAQLKVWEALYFSAKLRTDLTGAEIHRRIDKVLANLGILDKKDTIIGSPEKKVLSGGQRKRVNIAMELINDTPVIFLDEPTSGLSSYDAEGVIRLLKQLAGEGKTIITTIHQPSLDIFREFDNLIMISRDRGGHGSLAYFGPAYPESIEFFDAEGTRLIRSQPGKELSPEMLLSGLAKKKTAEWSQAYEASALKRQFVGERSGKVPSTPSQSSKSSTRGIGLGQWLTLVHRNFLLKARDKVQSAILLVQAPLFALLVGGVFRRLHEPNPALSPPLRAEQWANLGGEIIGIEFLMVVAAIWFGCNNVARDIVGEWTVYQRERMVSLKLPSYVFSKVTIAALLGFCQCLALLAIVTWICHLKGDFLETLLMLYLASMVGSAIGLCISACTETTEAAIAMLPLVLLPIVALGGGIRAIKDIQAPVKQISIVIPSRWAFEATYLKEIRMRHDAAANSPLPNAKEAAAQTNALIKRQFGQNEQHSSRTLFAVLAGMLVVLLGTVLLFLRMRDIV